MPVTAKDVAASAGVSIATVSRALAGSPRVAEATRQRVRRTAERMGYRPNVAARSLMTGTHDAVGVVVPDLANPFFAVIGKGIQQRAGSAAHGVFIADTDEDAGVEAATVRGLIGRVDGVILCSPRSGEGEIRSLAGRVPTVVVNRAVPGVASVTFDEHDAMRMLLRHLVALGHRSIAYAAGPVHSWADARRREALWEFAGAVAPRAVDETSPLGDVADVHITVLGRFPPRVSGGVQAADLALSAGATAVIGYNDLVAAGVVDRLRERGVRVPGDVSVAGFDDIPAAAMVRPALTTVHVPCLQAGRLAADVLLAQIVRARDGAEAPTGGASADIASRVVGGDLVIRRSTGPVRR